MTSDVGTIIQQAKQHHRKDMASTVTRAWAEAGATGGLEAGTQAAVAALTDSNPAALAATFALYAGTCALWGHGDYTSPPAGRIPQLDPHRRPPPCLDTCPSSAISIPAT